MTGPHPSWINPEPVEGGGWLVTGPCGSPHLKGCPFSWWRCPVCTVPGWRRRRTEARLLLERERIVALHYPGES